jgi:hypothetical protein
MKLLSKQLKRHQLLKLLYYKIQNVELQGVSKIHCSFIEITAKLKIDEKQLHKIAYVLLEEKEIDNFSVGLEKGFYETPKGVCAFTERKYIKLFCKNIWNSVKNWITIFSLIIAILALYLKITSDNEQIRKENKLIQERLYKLEQSIININSKN